MPRVWIAAVMGVYREHKAAPAAVAAMGETGQAVSSGDPLGISTEAILAVERDSGATGKQNA